MKNSKLQWILKVKAPGFVLLFLSVFSSRTASSQQAIYQWGGGCKGSTRVNTTYIPNKAICYQTVAFAKIDTGQFLISPNPFQSSFDISYTLQCNVDLHCKVVINDITGKLVYLSEYTAVAGVNRYRVCVHHLNPGVYLLAVVNSKGKIYYLSKLIKTD